MKPDHLFLLAPSMTYGSWGWFPISNHGKRRDLKEKAYLSKTGLETHSKLQAHPLALSITGKPS